MSFSGPAITLLFSLLSFDQPQWAARWRGDEVRVSEKGEWIKHTVVSRENLRDIAVRYGVDADHLRKWNKLSSSKLRRGRKLKVRAHRIAPPKEKIEVTVREGETWGAVAANWGVDTKDLHAWNYRVDELEPGTELTVWFDPARYWTVGRRLGPLPNHAMVRDDALSIGRPQKGRIENAVALPATSDYTCRSARLCWGSSYAVQGLQRAFANFRYETGYKGEIIIGSMSRQYGRRFPPHKSHQSGRDVDIRLPLLPFVPDWREPAAEEVDWMATWALIEALIDTGRVQTIFLESDLQRNLYEAARMMGRSHEELGPLITYPRDQPKKEAYVRHSKGHDGHIHVRFKCGPDEPKCRA